MYLKAWRYFKSAEYCMSAIFSNMHARRPECGIFFFSYIVISACCYFCTVLAGCANVETRFMNVLYC